MQNPGRLASRILAAGLLLSLAATVYLITQNNDLFGVALLATAFFALAHMALPVVIFLWASFHPAPAELTSGMRTSVTVSAVLLIVLGGLWIYMVRQGAILIVGALLVALGILALVRVWRTAITAATGGSRPAYAGSVAVGALLLFVVIVSIPKFACGCGGTKDKAYHAQMRSDLRNLVVAQEAYFADSLRYGTADELLATHAFYASTGVILSRVVVSDTTSWHAVVRHTQLADECGVFVGKPPAGDLHDAHEGEPKCWPAPVPADSR